MIKEIFEKVKVLREGRGMSTHELAEKSGMHQPTISRLDTGQIIAVDRLDDYITKMASALGINPADLISDGLEHLDLELRAFVKNPENLLWIKKAYHEKKLAEVTKELPMVKD